jgi:hypothetical protein
VFPDAIVVRYRDADPGQKMVGTIAAASHINGSELEVVIPVTLLRRRMTSVSSERYCGQHFLGGQCHEGQSLHTNCHGERAGRVG